MAIYTGALPIVGRIDILSFYKVGAQTRVRVRNPLSRKTVLKDPRFKNTRKFAGWMARASSIGSSVYKALPEDFRQFWMYRAFVGEAMQLLKKGMKDEDAKAHLHKVYVEVNYVTPVAQKQPSAKREQKLTRKQITIAKRNLATGIDKEIQQLCKLQEHEDQTINARKDCPRRFQSFRMRRAALLAS